MHKMLTEDAARGGKIRTETGPDREFKPGKSKESLQGREMKGGPEDLSHSLSGANATGAYNSK